MRNLLTFGLLFFVSVSFAFYKDTTLKIESYLLYTQKAESAIINKEFMMALKSYKKAFKLKKNPFGKDIYNALICALIVKEHKSAFIYVEILLSKGMSFKNIQQIEYINTLTNYPKWNLIKIKYQKKYFYKNYLCRVLDTLAYKDQYFRMKEGSYLVYGDTIKKIDRENDLILRKIISNFGYPDESIIGIPATGPAYAPAFDIVIWHQTPRNFISDYTPILISAVKHGKIDPHRAAELIENQTGNSRYSNQLFFKVTCDEGCSKSTKESTEKKLYYFNLTPKQITQININRRELFLEPIDEFRKKVLFDYKDNIFKFYYLSGMPTYSFDSEENLLEFIKPLSYIENDSPHNH